VIQYLAPEAVRDMVLMKCGVVKYRGWYKFRAQSSGPEAMKGRQGRGGEWRE
jgi:hypothetical protein